MDFRNELYDEIGSTLRTARVNVKGKEVWDLVDSIEHVAITFSQKQMDDRMSRYMTKEAVADFEKKLYESAEYADSLKREWEKSQSRVEDLVREKEALQREINELTDFKVTALITPEVLERMTDEIDFLRELALTNAGAKGDSRNERP